MDEPKHKEISLDTCMGDLEEGQLKKILDDFQEAWNSKAGFRFVPRRSFQSLEFPPVPMPKETIISADEILEGFDGVERIKSR